MKLQRNTHPNGIGKYVLIARRAAPDITYADWEPRSDVPMAAWDAVNSILGRYGLYLEFGVPGSDDEYFVVKLKDKNAPATLYAYAREAQHPTDERYAPDPELAADVRALAERAHNHPQQKQPE